MNPFFERSGALLGKEAMARLAAARVLVVGVGGVGSWCAEALARTGVGAITLVDDDVVQPSNVNRQCPATAAAIGRPKVEAMRERILAVNPACEVEARCERYAGGGDFSRYSAAADAIDSVGAGIGETVLITTGSSARLALHNTSAPADAVIVGIVD